MTGSYQVQIEDEFRRIEMTGASRADSPPPSWVEPATEKPRRSVGLRCLDFGVVLSVLLLHACHVYWRPGLMILAAFSLSVGLTIYWPLFAWALAALGPPDRPHVIAIIKPPDRLFCPRCGEERNDKHFSACGLDTEKAYRMTVRQLARYVVEDTEHQRNSLETSLQVYLQGIGEQQQKQLESSLKSMERNYVMQIARQHKLIRELQAQMSSAPAMLALPAATQVESELRGCRFV